SLALSDLQAWLADALGCSARGALPLARLVYDKTQGNPFFMTMFVRMLEQQRILSFDRTAHRSRWQLAPIRRLAITDNVVDLMVKRIRELDLPTQELVSLAASLGSQFDVRTLTLVGNRSEPECRAALRSVCTHGLLLTAGDRPSASEASAFRFLHD